MSIEQRILSPLDAFNILANAVLKDLSNGVVADYLSEDRYGVCRFENVYSFYIYEDDFFKIPKDVTIIIRRFHQTDGIQERGLRRIVKFIDVVEVDYECFIEAWRTHFLSQHKTIYIPNEND